ncbi:MAG: GTP pyrophosphokinase (EC, (p)ppGpp synthetase I [uncultured Thiotrichaceae bacterium]|uniref:GTP pyrophosphokinase n=1 Tax=uncultured Thiotrichaceae bacterium TaxID=298394 RepID=A0A6S6TS18_9GAMM|nr:MAG: GTP pyrophosphokinase (EC, (p)ppGpp synthetase I [uncultured Thiotrichaceae bacterium]
MQTSQHVTISADQLLDTLWVNDNEVDKKKLNLAITLSLSQQDSEESLPYSMQVALILQGLNVDQETLIVCILSDRDLTAKLDEEELTKKYSSHIAALVKSVRWINNFRNCEGEHLHTAPTEPEQAERLRGMLLAMVQDVRVVLIKLAWRLQYLRNLNDTTETMQLCVAQETMDIFAPLANRLGVNQLKWELEDLSFRYLKPHTYKTIAKALSVKRTERETYMDEFVQTLKNLTESLKLESKVYGRPKHIYSIYRKMQRKQLDSIDELFDLRAIRIIVHNISTCYALLGEIHARWRNIPKEYDDYIANRKANGYQSLHTVIYGPHGKTVEIQIRTFDMHTAAELGVAAHWQYKEGGTQDSAMESAIASLRNLIETNDNDNNQNLLDDFRSEIFPDRVFALTPKGDVIDLPKHATPLDFAYSIHTSIGHRCNGAKVNGKMVPLTYSLQNGEQVKVLTQKEEKPKRSWLNPSLGYLRSSKARYSVRHWLRQQDHETNKRDGLLLLEREALRLGVDMPDINSMVKKFKLQRKSEFLIALGRGDIGTQQLANVLMPPPEEEPKLENFIRPEKTNSQSGIQVNGVDNLLVNIANCCKPVPGDDIIGYITVGRGVSIHRKTCPNINTSHLTEEQQSRLVEVSWGQEQRHYSVDIVVTGIDRPGLLRDVANVLAVENANILDIGISNEPNTLRSSINITMQIENTSHLEQVVNKLNDLNSVIDIRR